MTPINNGTVQTDVPVDGAFGYGGAEIILWLAHMADEIGPWGRNMRARDIKLREFYKQEPFLSSAIYSVVTKRAGYKWILNGPERQVNIEHRILHGSQHGYGWNALIVPYLRDMLTQDNGGFIELVRERRGDASSVVVQLNHLDASRCIRTGNWDKPVIYKDLGGELHYMQWYEVFAGAEYPDPDEVMRGYQQCAVSRLLMKAQTMRDLGIFESEKIGGRNPSTVHFIGGVQQQRIENIMKMNQQKADNSGYLHYMPTPIIAALDATARVSHEQVDLKGVPDGFDIEANNRWYGLILALALGVDPQDIMPLPGGNLGSAQQSQVLRESGRSKGNALFMSNMEHMMNFHGVLPRTVSFKYQEQDLAEDAERTQLAWRRAQTYRMYAGTPTTTEILPPAIIRQMMRDAGDLKQDYLDELGEPDLTPNIDRVSDERA